MVAFLLKRIVNLHTETLAALLLLEIGLQKISHALDGCREIVRRRRLTVCMLMPTPAYTLAQTIKLPKSTLHATTGIQGIVDWLRKFAFMRMNILV
jgi:hypothetical protein